ncbi:MAG: peptide chain release factor N(5)-glutamine methyltransferase [Acetobacteraceae bacterium]|nr:peptide chain release factor N(5)-glutamine methyltransferase [Acetobacteraceae bacterium]
MNNGEHVPPLRSPSIHSSLGEPTIGGALQYGAQLLMAAGIENPRREARLLLAHVIGGGTEELLRDLAAPADITAYNTLLDRRCRREPLAFILGRRGFWTMDLMVSRATLIPRPETETLIEAARAWFLGHPGPDRILDLGTGTGCLLLAALSEFPQAFGVGVDVVPEAARLAAANSAVTGLADRATFLCGCWADALSGTFDLVLCNPPYIRSAQISGLMPEVACHEPPSALDGGPDGLDAYRTLASVLPHIMSSDALAVLELGAGQAENVADLARCCGFSATTRPDLSGMPRAVILRRALLP